MKKLLVALVLVLLGAGIVLALDKAGVMPQNSPTPTPSNSISPTPTVSVSVTPTPSVSPVANITVTSPKSGATVGNPITVTGKARVFENTFAYGLRDTSGRKLYENNAMTDARDSSQFGNYTVKIPVPVNAPINVVVEVWEYSAKDGSVINLVRVPVKLATQQTMTVKTYFSKTSTTNTDCSVVESTNRTIIQSNEPAFSSIIELLKGLTTAEKQAGYITSIPENVRLNSLILRGSTITADFDETLQMGVGGSCRVTAIRAQITQTLRQFSSIKTVVISINGKTTDILQP
ncbi:MAG: GerMN domain-containing protein [Candidatus Yanofskybacteria bacterium]|nr:GerMN domain-containing protein [Candidatus Yanofskybacteria bacterium]